MSAADDARRLAEAVRKLSPTALRQEVWRARESLDLRDRQELLRVARLVIAVERLATTGTTTPGGKR